MYLHYQQGCIIGVKRPHGFFRKRSFAIKLPFIIYEHLSPVFGRPRFCPPCLRLGTRKPPPRRLPSTGQYSVAGALRLPEQTTKRHVYGMNVGWKFFKGRDAPQGVTGADFDDSSWQSVNLLTEPELLPEEASGCSNYQGPVWYRKTFTAPCRSERQEKYPCILKRIMGKSEIMGERREGRRTFRRVSPRHRESGQVAEAGPEERHRREGGQFQRQPYPPGKPQESLVLPISAAFTVMRT